jgi:ABC-type uncharacterized transport system substrate-binding protein
LSARSPAEAGADLTAFTIEYRWAEGRYDRLPALASELTARQVTVIAAVGGEPSGLAAKAATATIPIVCTLGGGDAVEAGLVPRLNRPGGNITGVSIIGPEMGPKRVELAHQLVPNGNALAALVNPKYPLALAEARDMQAAADSLSLQLLTLNASTEKEIDVAFATLSRRKVDALLIAISTEIICSEQADFCPASECREAARHDCPDSLAKDGARALGRSACQDQSCADGATLKGA